MNYEKLLVGKSYKDFDDLLENWYSRLNKIKSKYATNKESEEYQYWETDNKKAEKLVTELAKRLEFLFRVQIAIQVRLSQPKYPRGC